MGLAVSPVIFIKLLPRRTHRGTRHSRENMSLTLKAQHVIQARLTTASQKYLFKGTLLFKHM